METEITVRSVQFGWELPLDADTRAYRVKVTFSVKSQLHSFEIAIDAPTGRKGEFQTIEEAIDAARKPLVDFARSLLDAANKPLKIKIGVPSQI